jgi:hypothetical protein
LARVERLETKNAVDASKIQGLEEKDAIQATEIKELKAEIKILKVENTADRVSCFVFAEGAV